MLLFTQFTSCELEDGENDQINLTESDYYLQVNVGGEYIDIRHGLDYQVQPNLTFENTCEVLFDNCKSADDAVSFLAVSFGKNSKSMLNFAITNISLDSEDINEESDLVKIVQNLPRNSNGSLVFTNGTATSGITSGNLYFGTDDNILTYTYEPVSWAKFSITEIKKETFNNKNAVGIGFTIECRIKDEDTGEDIIVSNGSGYLPFTLQ